MTQLSDLRRRAVSILGLRRRSRQSIASHEQGPHDGLDGPAVLFCCNICDARSTVSLALLTREEPTCSACRSTVRMRTVIRVLSLELFGRSLAISEFPVRRELRGIGLSDWPVYGERLAKRLGYVNTFLDREPRLDIKNVPRQSFEPVDFLIATDVFEHVAPPIQPAFDNARRLLKPGGLMVFSVPYVNEPGSVTREHFPDLYDFRLQQIGGTRTLVNTTIDGRVQTFEDLVFHGGEGLTLEMRLFSEESLRQEFHRAGFDRLKFHDESELRFGINWPITTSLVLSARAA